MHHAKNQGLVWLAGVVQAASQRFGQPESWARADSSLPREPRYAQLAKRLHHIAFDRCARSCLWI